MLLRYAAQSLPLLCLRSHCRGFALRSLPLPARCCRTLPSLAAARCAATPWLCLTRSLRDLASSVAPLPARPQAALPDAVAPLPCRLASTVVGARMTVPKMGDRDASALRAFAAGASALGGLREDRLGAFFLLVFRRGTGPRHEVVASPLLST